MKDAFLNKDTAKQYRTIRKLLRGNEPVSDDMASEINHIHEELDREPDGQNSLFGWTMFAIAMLIAILMLCGPCTPAHAQEAYSNEEIVKAIYLAEGSWKAEHPYGIVSVDCSSKAQCYHICLNTVKRNRIRFKRYGYRNYPDFISFLGSRYCPTHGRTLSKAERRLNPNWVKNVMYFLRRDA